jgi:hypothetical protein
MAENIPTPPGGAMPPRPAEAAKVQPKKETVRINLPPKPTSAPTIKLPTLAPGSAPPASPAASAPTHAAVATAAPAAPSAPKAPAPPAPPPSAAPATRVAAPASQLKSVATAAPAAAPRPAYAGAGLTGLDKALAIAAAVIALASAGIVAYLVFFLKDTGS